MRKAIRGGQARLIEVDIERVVYGGDGLARHEGQVVFVPRGLPGERLRALVVQRGKGFARGRPAEWLNTHPDRRPSPCPFFPRCGGCAHQDASYPLQVSLKTGILRESLRRSAVVFDGEIEMVPSPEEGWRSRARFHVEARFGDVRLGLFAEGSHRVVDLAHCLQLSAGLNRAAEEARDVLRRHPRLAASTTDVELVESHDEVCRVAVFHLRSAADAIETFSPPRGSVLTGWGLSVNDPAEDRFATLSGSPEVEVRVGDRRLRAHAQSFFQANRFLAPALADHVAASVPAGESVVDLYAGIGFFAVALSSQAAVVTAVESAPTAVADARANVHRLGLRNVAVRRSEVEAYVRSGRADDSGIVVLDPPRTGAGVAVIAALASGKVSRLVYVSCDPPTLGRDLREAARHGFVVTGLRGFDMFPDTSHLEAVAVIDR